MVELIYEKKIILKEMVYAKSIWEISRGLMFANKKTVKKGICLKMPNWGKLIPPSITMFFCFHPMDILFLDENFKIVDKTTLKPWQASYTPKNWKKKNIKYVIESYEGKFKNFYIGKTVNLIFL